MRQLNQESRIKNRESRIAPTPSGYLHQGNAANFLLNARLATPNGNLLLRIDDLDRARYRPEYVEDTFRLLNQLGINITEGPTTTEELEEQWTQYRRLGEYYNALNLLERSDRLFACACSRKELYDGNHPYGCLEGKISLEEDGVAWRINSRGLPPVVIPDLVREEPFVIDVDACMRDFAVRRKDDLPSYQLACTVDDAEFGINTVGRGQDLLPSTAAQILLADLIGLEPVLERMEFIHHPLIRDEAGEKISKSAGSGGSPMVLTDADIADLHKLVDSWLGQS